MITATARKPLTWSQRWLRKLSYHRWLYLMLFPGIVYFILFQYVPMYGIIISFQDYFPYLGIMHSKWVGLKHFHALFSDPNFYMILKNTVILALYNIFFFFPLPIIIAIMLNELKSPGFKRVTQSLIYLPHFISWPVVVGLTFTAFSNADGLVNKLLEFMSMDQVNFLGTPDYFRTFITSQVIWKETGWGTIIFLAALTGIDPQLYEAAKIDGANRFQQMWHVTLPALRTTIILLLILRLGSFLNSGFEQIFLMLTPLNRNVGEVFDTFVYTAGIANGQLSYSTAVGLFKSIVGLVLVLLSNNLAKRFGEEGVY